LQSFFSSVWVSGPPFFDIDLRREVETCSVEEEFLSVFFYFDLIVFMLFFYRARVSLLFFFFYGRCPYHCLLIVFVSPWSPVPSTAFAFPKNSVGSSGERARFVAFLAALVCFLALYLKPFLKLCEPQSDFLPLTIRKYPGVHMKTFSYFGLPPGFVVLREFLVVRVLFCLGFVSHSPSLCSQGIWWFL